MQGEVAAGVAGMTGETARAVGVWVTVSAALLLALAAFILGRVSRLRPTLLALGVGGAASLVVGLYLATSGPAEARGGAAGAGGDDAWVLPRKASLATLSGETLYELSCIACHGERGRGDGPLAAVLAVPPANIMEHLDHHPEEHLIDYLLSGIPPAMPPTPVSEAEARRVLAYLRGIQRGLE